MSNLRKWADEHQYDAEPQEATEDQGVQPKVTLLWMTPDPLGAVAAMAAMYKGKVVRSLSEVSDDERREAFVDVQKTHLKAPLEAVKLHFLFEGVDRAFTHQHVRQRTAVYAQESMRFAVLGDLLEATTLPPSLAGTQKSEGDPARVSIEDIVGSGVYALADGPTRKRALWDYTIGVIDEVYHILVESGMPSEEARGLLPHCTATRLHYVTDLRNLSDHAGNRLCTQAQFHWRLVFAGVVDAIRRFPRKEHLPVEDWWQFEAIADSALFRPVCYQLNYCPFEASFDRSCTIRSRVQMFSGHGIPSRQWDDKDKVTNGIPIRNEEWLLNPAAARKRA